jgi:hypothetical protein
LIQQKKPESKRGDTVVNEKKKTNIPPQPFYNFPDPCSDDDDLGLDDAITCLHKAAEYEKWAERAKNCGRDDLAILYEIAAEQFFTYYKCFERG